MVSQFGWVEFGLFAGSLLATIVLGCLIALAVVNPVVAGISYATWCLGVGIKIGMKP